MPDMDVGMTVGLIKALGSPDPAVIEGAVSDWLDDHPEATTTVEDGAISYAKLDSGLKGTVDDVGDLKTSVSSIEDDVDVLNDNALILDETSKAYYHNVAPRKIIVYPNAYTQNIPVRYVGSECLASIELLGTIPSISGITVSKDGRFLFVKGKTENNVSLSLLNLVNTYSPDVVFLQRLAGKTVNVCLYVNMANSWAKDSYFQIYVNNTSSILKKYYSSFSAWNVWTNVQFPAELSRVRIYFDNIQDTVFSDGDFFWLGIYEATPVITETLVTTDPVDITASDLTKVDTMMHESTVETIVPTKTYVDNHVPTIDFDEEVYGRMVCVMPEIFGAKGDNSTDDSSAINQCLTYAASHNIAVRGYGKYKIASSVTVPGREMDVYIHRLNYTGNSGSAVICSGLNNLIKIDEIVSGYDGFTMQSSSEVNASNTEVRIVKINATNHGVVFDNTEGGNVLYNKLFIDNISATNGDCYHTTHGTNGGYIGEINLFNTTCACPNGWAINDINGRAYGFTLESDCLNGIRVAHENTGSYLNFRIRELVDKIVRRQAGVDQSQGGTLIKFDEGSEKALIRFVSEDFVPYAAIDTSDVRSQEEYYEDEHSYFIGNCYSVIDAPIRVGQWDGGNNGFYNLGKQMLVVKNKDKVCIPAFSSKYEITSADYDMRDPTNDTQIAVIYPTKMIIGVDDCVIHLSTSYCSYGYNEVVVDQNQGHLCTIYSAYDDQSPIFDGATLGAGVYRLTCYCDPEDNYINNVDRTPPYYRLYNDLNGDVWEVEKISG